MVLCYCQKVWKAYSFPSAENHGDTIDEGLIFENPLSEHSFADESLPDYDAVNFELETNAIGEDGDDPEEKEDLTKILDQEN